MTFKILGRKELPKIWPDGINSRSRDLRARGILVEICKNRGIWEGNSRILQLLNENMTNFLHFFMDFEKKKNCTNSKLSYIWVLRQ